MRGCTVPCARRNAPTQVTARVVRRYVAVTIRAVITNSDVLVRIIMAYQKKFPVLNMLNLNQQQCDIMALVIVILVPMQFRC